jgi:predicted nucleic acid-binding protein
VAERVLVDTSVWVDHLRRGNTGLVGLLNAAQVCTHPFVIGELACGNLSQRATILAALDALPKVSAPDHSAVLALVEQAKLMGRGLGWIDVSLLASAAHGGVVLWTLDRRLATAASKLNVTLKT